MKFKLLVLFGFIVSLGLQAQNKTKNIYSIEIDAPFKKNEMIYLVNYWNGAMYIRDSVQLSNVGKAQFESNDKWDTGQYMLYIKPDAQLEMLLSDEKQVKVTIRNDIRKSKVEGSSDTGILWQYIRKVRDSNDATSALQEKNNVENLSEAERKAISDNVNQLSKELDLYVDGLIKQNKGRWISDFLKGMQMVDAPIRDIKSSADAATNRQYLINHYFDNINLQDPRFLRTNYLQSNIENYMENIVDQSPDSLANAASRLVAKTQGNDLCFEQMLSYFTNNSLQSKRMGAENIWMKLAEEYVFDKEVSWIDSAQVMELKRKYVPNEHNRIGMKAYNLPMQTITGDSISLYDIKADYIILYFYDPSCGYCQKETPLIHDGIYAKYKSRGLEVVAMNIMHEETSWNNFVRQHKITDWLNCADPQYKSQYWLHYNTTGVPSVYVIDKDRKIMAKSINEEGLKQIFEYIYPENGTN